MLDVQDLHVFYGEIHALKGVSFRVAQGGSRSSAATAPARPPR
jgi:ABC-type branched-subunit amino acid transport system ATPase component